MSYTDDAVKAKLSALNETQESIVTVAQWIMFHRRHADRTVALWLTRLRDSGSNKRLNLIYLANEVAQQSKARNKEDFLIELSPIIAEASALAYKGATSEVQSRLRRVFEVWRQRQIFEGPILDALEARIDELDKSRSSGKKSLGGSLFSSSPGPSAPAEIQPLVPLQIHLSKAAATTTNAVPTADAEYEKLTDSTKTVPSPPVYAARLSALLKNLASAEGAVSDSIKARRALLEGLNKIVEANKTALSAEEQKHAELSSRKATIDSRKREVEDGIMRGLSAESSPVTPGTHGSDPRANGGIKRESVSLDPERPDIEELTPPPLESLTPESDNPKVPPSMKTSSFIQSPSASMPATAAGSDLLSSLTMQPLNYAGGRSGENLSKKRKLEEDDPVFGSGGDAMADLDEDVAELLRAESGGR